MNIIIEHALLLLAVAILVALLAYRLKLPYTVGLVVTGILLNLAHIKLDVKLTPEFIYDIILPPLLFEAALNIHWQELRHDIVPIMVLSIFGVLVSAAFVAWGTTYFLGWPLTASLVFGVLIAATDPVAVIAMFKDNGVKGRLRLLVESESLFNDGVAAVLFALVLTWAMGIADVTPLYVVHTLGIKVGGGIMIGAVSGIAAVLIAGHITDHLVETAITTLVAYGSFLLAEHIHVSGVLATVMAGLIMGNPDILKNGKATNTLSERGHAFILDFWEFIAFLANSLIFLLIGLRVAAISFPVLGAVTILVILLVILSRALAVYPLCLPLSRSKWAIPLRHQHILWWGGLRGALGIALSLSLPDSLAFHDEIVTATFAVVVFSVVIQGVTMPLLLKKIQ